MVQQSNNTDQDDGAAAAGAEALLDWLTLSPSPSIRIYKNFE